MKVPVTTLFWNWPTVSVKGCTAFGLMPLLAVIVNGNVPGPVGVPVMSAVPFPSSVKVTPAGSVPDSLRLGVGVPVVKTLKELRTFTTKVAEFGVVMVGGKVVDAGLTVSVNG